jgi:hypothetical protein
MPANGIRIRRPAQKLPIELVQRNSNVDLLITLAGDSATNRTFGFESMVKTTRHVIRQHCSGYQPSSQSPFDILCKSGESDGNPSRGSLCFNCRVSQFSANGFFTGEMTEKEAPETHIDPVMASQSDLRLSDFIKSLEESV